VSMMKLKPILPSIVVVLASLALVQPVNASVAVGKQRAKKYMLVKVYFYHDPGEYIDLSPVTRYVSVTTPARAAIQALLNGPTPAEQKQGFDSLASVSEFDIGSLKIVGGTARINFVSSRAWAGWPGDLGPIRFKKAVELTLKQFPNVQSVIVSLNGNPNFDRE